jgi:DNA mismatch repair ATPase MutS
MEWLAWRRRWYRDYWRDVEYGRRRIRNLLIAAAELRDSLEAIESAHLKTIARQISDLLNTSEMRALLRLSTATSSASWRGFDQLARDDGKPTILRVLHCMGEVEALWSVATATIEHHWAYPRPGARLVISGLFHPFLGRDSVPNDLDIAQEVHVCFVTGPNMAGKTTFMKAVAIALLLRPYRVRRPRATMEFPVVGTIFSSIDIADNLNAGESFYLVEVGRIRALAMALSEHGSGLAVIDEPFRGTNVHDAAEATIATLTRLATLPVGLVLGGFARRRGGFSASRQTSDTPRSFLRERSRRSAALRLQTPCGCFDPAARHDLAEAGARVGIPRAPRGMTATGLRPLVHGSA